MDACSRTRKVLAGEAPGPGAGWVCPGGPTASHRVHLSPGVGPYPSRFADRKADDSDSATSQTRPEANHDFLRRLALCQSGRQDLNLRPHGPEASTHVIAEKQKGSFVPILYVENGGFAM